MRQRRIGICLQRAERAIETGRFDDARAALDEASALSPGGSPEAAALERRLAAAETAPDPLPVEPEPALAGPAPTPADVEPTPAIPEADAAPPPEPHAAAGDAFGTRKRLQIAAAAAVLLLGASGAALSAGYWFWTSSPADAPAETPAPAAPGSEPRGGTTEIRGVRLTIVHDTVVAKQAALRFVEDAPVLRAETTPPPEPSREPEQPVRTEPPVVLALNRTQPEPELPVALDVRSEVQTGALPAQTLAAPPLAAEPPPAAAPPPDSASGAPARPDVTAERARATAGIIAEAALPEESIVLDVLERYERAYSRLDADAASAIWPKVNRGALARAFDGLASQRVSLGSCEVDIKGAAASATCSGTATWEPKIGGGRRTEARRWNFELRKAGGAWRIERAIAH